MRSRAHGHGGSRGASQARQSRPQRHAPSDWQLRTLRSLLRILEGEHSTAAVLLGVSERSVHRWLARSCAMSPTVYAVLRMLLWLDDEGVDLAALAERDPAALAALRATAAEGDEVELGRDGTPVLRPLVTP